MEYQPLTLTNEQKKSPTSSRGAFNYANFSSADLILSAASRSFSSAAA